MIRILFIILVAIHGLIHLMGFAKAFNLARIDQLTKPISRPMGLLWLAAALLFMAMVAAYLAKADKWWIIAFASIILSQGLVILLWKDAKFGTIANLIILIVTIIGFASWRFTDTAHLELSVLRAGMAGDERIVAETMVDTLPPPVEKWLRRANIVGGKFASSVHLTQAGRMRTAPDGRWMPFSAEQWYTAKRPGFLWLADVSAAPGLFISGRDTFVDGKGRMLIKLLSLIRVADVKGKEIDQGAMVRYLAEIMWFPSAALEEYVRWEPVDASSAKAVMTWGGMTVEALFRFDDKGDPAGLTARRYYKNTLEDWVIEIDPKSFRDFGGERVPTRAAVTWKLKEGYFRWLEVEVTGVEFGAPLR